MKKKIIVTLTICALAFGLCIIALFPLVLCEADIPNDYIEAIDNQAKEAYSPILPLIPVYVTVDCFSFNTVYYTIHYFPFGTVGMSYKGNGGYNIEKPLR